MSESDCSQAIFRIVTYLYSRINTFQFHFTLDDFIELSEESNYSLSELQKYYSKDDIIQMSHMKLKQNLEYGVYYELFSKFQDFLGDDIWFTITKNVLEFETYENTIKRLDLDLVDAKAVEYLLKTLPPERVPKLSWDLMQSFYLIIKDSCFNNDLPSETKEVDCRNNPLSHPDYKFISLKVDTLEKLDDTCDLFKIVYGNYDKLARYLKTHSWYEYLNVHSESHFQLQYIKEKLLSCLFETIHDVYLNNMDQIGISLKKRPRDSEPSLTDFLIFLDFIPGLPSLRYFMTTKRSDVMSLTYGERCVDYLKHLGAKTYEYNPSWTDSTQYIREIDDEQAIKSADYFESLYGAGEKKYSLIALDRKQRIDRYAPNAAGVGSSK